ncbi:MAG: response regulator transcription factor [Pyrinomonadaceae bacterium]|nr:response regulator transcription factor [Pyrinomonadaceae bacterium]
MIRVLIADDHTIVRHGLRQILSSEQDMAVSAEAQNGQEVLDIVRREHVDIVVLDISMPGRNGLETLKELKRHHPGIAVIVLSMHPKDQYAVRVIKAGASGYITKESAPSELVVAIRKACRGEKYIDPEIAEVLANYIEHGGTEDPHTRLSDREYEVLCHIASGKGLTEISQEMNLSVKTISTYRSRIIEKTGLSSNAEITRYAISRGLT